MEVSPLEELRSVLTLHEDTGEFYWNISSGQAKKGKRAGTLNSLGYIQIKYRGVCYLAHRLVWYFLYGTLPENTIDHKDRDRANNRPSNLRDVPLSLNLHNRGGSSTALSKYKGVAKAKRKRWRASITVNGLRIDLGSYGSEEEAALAYNKEAYVRHGEMAFQNKLEERLNAR